jgi:hypothetical protein
MIAKKVKNPKKSAGKAARVNGLVSYVLSPTKEDEQEKCVYHGSRNFITVKPLSMMREMIALSQEAVRSKDPISHYVLSWKSGEVPAGEEIERTMDIFLKELEVEDHQVIYGLHSDTNNFHLHIVINRVHPDSLKCVQINNGFDIKAIHKAVAKIEATMGWKPEENALYEVMEDGRVVERRREKTDKRKPDQWKVDKEKRTGEKSAERIAMEEGAPVIAAAQSWLELHRSLAEIGMRYVKRGSGAVVFVGEVAIKASSVARGASLGNLEKRLGPYEESPLRDKVKPRTEGKGDEEEKKEEKDGDAQQRIGPKTKGKDKAKEEAKTKPGGSAGDRDGSSGEGESNAGSRSRHREIPKDDVVKIVRRARDWQEFHKLLGKIGLRYIKKGSGAIFVMDDFSQKASSVARAASLKSMEKRFGRYKEAELEFEPKK